MRYVAGKAETGGLRVRRDGIGNLVVETPGEFEEWVETGSHIDTVPDGGNYDGAAGVIAGLAVLLHVQEKNIKLKRGLRLRIWRGEESAAFGIVSAGSRAAFGLLDVKALSAIHDGRSLAAAIREQGFDPSPVESEEPTISDQERDAIAAYIEFHIEQGSVLESEKTDIGIVSGIRGSIRSRVIVRGRFDHSGATPVGTAYRRDANLAIAHMQVRLDALARTFIGDGRDIVQTIGEVNAGSLADRYPELAGNAVTKVSGFGCFSHEVRGVDGDEVRSFVSQARETIRETAKEFGVDADIEEFSAVDGIAALDSDIQQRSIEACIKIGASHRGMPSGAWHDAAVVHGAQKSDGSSIPTGMIFIPCRNGVSHSPDEYASPEQIALGANVLLEAMLSI